jgi:DNA-binding CsgD family transcriptional regulator
MDDKPDVDERGRTSGVIGDAGDITARQPAAGELRRLKRDLALRSRIAHAFLISPRDRVHADVLGFLLEEFESEYGYLGYIDEAGDLVCPSMTRDIWEKCRMKEKSVLFQRQDWGGLWGASLEQQRSLVRNGELNPPQGHLPLQSAVVVPMILQGRLVGQIALANRKEGYGPEQLKRLESVAEFMGPILRLGIERAEAQRGLYEQAVKLEEKNTALSVLLEHREEEKKRVAGRVTGNFEKLVFPYLNKLEAGGGEAAVAYVSILKKNIRESLAPLDGSGTLRYAGFTPSEVQVADLIKAGKTSKEIADLMNISLRSVYFHRNNIRKKLNISNKKANLQAVLSDGG